MQPTLANIARLAEVNPSTVSRIVNGSTKFPVSPQTRDRVLKIAEKLNYQPKRAARALVSGKSFTAAAVLGRFERDLSTPTFALILGELTRELWRHGYALTMLPIDPAKGIDDEILRTVRGSHADGYFVPFSMLQPKTLAELRRAGTPVVSIRRPDEQEPLHNADQPSRDGVVSYARLDETTAAREVIDELVRLGHRDVLCFGYDTLCQQRFKPYHEAAQTLRNHALRLRTCAYQRQTSIWSYARAEARQAAEAHFDAIAGCTAVLCVSDQVALGLMDALIARGIEPGRDISVVGQDNLEENPAGAVDDPMLATVDRNNDGLGRAIAQLLLERMTGQARGVRTVTLPTRLIRRRTLGPAPIP